MGHININSEHYFVLCTGQAIKNLEELIIILKKIDKKTFEYHVNQNKNDFANWIRYVFKSKKTAEIISDYNYDNRQKIIKLLRKFLDERKILVLNGGSSTLKFQLIELVTKNLLAKGIVDAMNTDKCTIKANINNVFASY